jgi:hypothetical protein
VLPQVLFLATVSALITCPREVDVIFHTVYASSASKAFTKPDLQALLQEIRPKNADLGVTGMLLYKDGNFMQALEGEQEVLTRLVRIIQHDSRHQGLLVLLRGMSDQRLFPDWSMGFRDLADERTAKTPGYSDFMNTPLTDAEFSRDPNRCMKLMLLFKKNI